MGAATAGAQESGALIDALIRKGILTNQEAEDIRAELVRENNTVPSRAMAYGKSTDRLSVGMRMQAQYNYLDTEVPAAPRLGRWRRITRCCGGCTCRSRPGSGVRGEPR
jgi:hypothetical protein